MESSESQWIYIPQRKRSWVDSDRSPRFWGTSRPVSRQQLFVLPTTSGPDFALLIADLLVEQYDWVAQEDWIFSRLLPATSLGGREWSSFKKVFLVFDGIDTAARLFSMATRSVWQTTCTGNGPTTSPRLSLSWNSDLGGRHKKPYQLCDGSVRVHGVSLHDFPKLCYSVPGRSAVYSQGNTQQQQLAQQTAD